MAHLPWISSLAAAGLLGLSSCAPVGSEEISDDEPVVGRLKFNDRVIDLTPSAFADHPGAVPRDAVGHIIADIDLRETPAAGTQSVETAPQRGGARMRR